VDGADWRAVRDFIVVATHGAPDTLSYLDEEWQAMTGRERQYGDGDDL
jgi:hypothetical protein